MIYEAISRVGHYIAYTDFKADYVVSRGARPERVTTIGVGVDQQILWPNAHLDKARQQLQDFHSTGR